MRHGVRVSGGGPEDDARDARAAATYNIHILVEVVVAGTAIHVVRVCGVCAAHTRQLSVSSAAHRRGGFSTLEERGFRLFG